MAATPTPDPIPQDLSSHCLEHAPMAMATVEGAMHVVRYVNPAFCRLIDKTGDELVGMPFRAMLPGSGEGQALLDRVYRTGTPEGFTQQEHSAVWSYTAWPVMVDEQRVGVVLQVLETAPLYEQAVAMNEALVLGSLRQHELTAVANSSNTRLQTEIGERRQGERDAQMLTNEVSHRIKNNLQIVIGLIRREARRAPPPCVPGYETIQAHIRAIAELYDLISHSSRGSQVVPVDEYLREIAVTMSASLLERSSSITIEVTAEAVYIDPGRAVPFGLLVNELTTNAIKHAFPHGTGRIVLSVRLIGDQIELDVADDGVGMKGSDSEKASERHGSDYVAIFARQLGGTLAVLKSERTGTTVRTQFPLIMPL